MSEISHNPEHELELANRKIAQLHAQLRETQAAAAHVRDEMHRKMRDFARDFRGPLTAVLGFSDVLSATCKSDLAELNEIAMAGHQLMTLITELERSVPYETPGTDLPAQAGPASGSSRVRTILQIEDNEGNFHLVQRILEDRANIELIWAPTGEEGISLASQRNPALVLLDLNLPDIHGSAVLTRLKNNPATAGVPVIVLSADITPSQIERMLQAGASNYLTKPFEIKRLLCLVDESLAAV
ncbi:MAG: hypothetical protein QOC70_2977 [Verrucomicrobiota bacterium]